MDPIKGVDKVYGVSNDRIRMTISCDYQNLSTQLLFRFVMAMMTSAFIFNFLSITSAICDHFIQTYLGTTNVHFVELLMKYSF